MAAAAGTAGFFGISHPDSDISTDTYIHYIHRGVRDRGRRAVRLAVDGVLHEAEVPQGLPVRSLEESLVLLAFRSSMLDKMARSRVPPRRAGLRRQQLLRSLLASVPHRFRHAFAEKLCSALGMHGVLRFPQFLRQPGDGVLRQDTTRPGDGSGRDCQHQPSNDGPSERGAGRRGHRHTEARHRATAAGQTATTTTTAR